MLIFFWQSEDSLGMARCARWWHESEYSPRVLVGADYGFGVLNPFKTSPNICQESFDYQVTAFTPYQDQILLGTTSGIYQMSKATLPYRECLVESPVDITDQISSFISTIEPVISMDAYEQELSVVTTAGLHHYPSDTVEVSVSGTKCLYTDRPKLYWAAGQSLFSKTSPFEAAGWEQELQFANPILDFWVTMGEPDTVFVSTAAGVDVIRGTELDYRYTGLDTVTSVSAELDSVHNHGHLFCLAGASLKVLNLKHRTIETEITLDNDQTAVVTYPRFYHR